MLKQIFDMDNPVMRGMGVAADLLLLNLFTLLCALPIVTAGAAFTALNDVVSRIVRGEFPAVTAAYFRSFRNNFKQGTLLGLLFLLCAVILLVDYTLANFFTPFLRLGPAAIAIALLAVMIYAFALLARYENSLSGTLKNALSLAVGFFPQTAGMLLFVIGFWLICIWFARYALPVALMFGASLPCYLCALLYVPIFQNIENSGEPDGTEPSGESPSDESAEDSREA